MPREDGSVSFYFFDFDDNSMFLETPVFVKNTQTGDVKEVSTTAWATVRNQLGTPGEWEDWAYFDGTYSHFSDIPADQLKPGQEQYFVEDIKKALEEPANKWQAPAWDLLAYACAKGRPVAFVTARGHSRETIKAGVRVLVERGLLEQEPNYLGVWAVSNPDMVDELIDSLDDPAEQARLRAMEDPVSSLKRIAIRKLVDKGIDLYGAEPEHRFGMSDDDPKNVDLIIKAMTDCKKKYLDKRFFVINTHQGEHAKLEVFPIDYPVTSRADHDEAVG